MNEINLSVYRSALDKDGTSKSMAAIISTISGKTGESAILSQQIEKLRELYTELQAEKIKIENGRENKSQVKKVEQLQKTYDALKLDLPAVTWSGLFSKRNAKSIKTYSGFICIDIDKLDTAEVYEIKKALSFDQYTYCVFVSPSGHGLKVLFKVAGTDQQHKDYFLSIEQYFKDLYEIEIDKSGKDICRLCFFSYDESLYLNEESKVFEVTKPITETDKKEIKRLADDIKDQVTSAGYNLNEIYRFTENKIPYTEGNRNRFLYLFACNANRSGVSMGDTYDYCISNMPDRTNAEIRQTVENAYNNNLNEHGIYGKKEKSSKEVDSKKSNQKNKGQWISINGQTKDSNSNSIHAERSSDNAAHRKYIQFWKEYKVEKGRGEKKYEKKVVELQRVKFTRYLHSEGFHLLTTGENGFEMCYTNEGVVAPVDPHKIKQHVLRWVKNEGLEDVEEMLRKGQKQYFAFNELDSLPYREIDFKSDTAEESYFYFRNCWVSVNNDGDITTHEYSTLQKHIWASNKIPYKFTKENFFSYDGDTGLIVDYSKFNCEFAKFVALASYNPNSEEEKDFSRETITQRFHSFCTSIGYLLDSYKHPAIRKGIFAIDHRIGEKGEQNGRTGKSILSTACGYMKKVSVINGKKFDPKYQFSFEPITLDTQIIAFNDMPKQFDVESIFEVIADDYSVNRRQTGFIHFPYKISPKVYVSSNFIPKGEGDSYSGRMHIIEFCDYFNSRHSPYDEFGHSLFTDWSEDEWNKFFNFMLYCVALYKMQGLIEYPKGNFDSRKLVNEVVQEFIDFMDDPTPETGVQRNVRIKKIELLDKYNAIHNQLYSNKLKPHTFAKWVKQYCKNKGLQFNPDKKGGFDKSNSIEYYTIADGNYKSNQT